MASWYGDEYRGKRTASGERFDPSDHTAAHPSLPFGTRIRVTNVRDGRSVVVRINDRGPAGNRPGIDLSLAAARVIGLVRVGTMPVLLSPVDGAQVAEAQDWPATSGLARGKWGVVYDGNVTQPPGDRR